MLANQHWSPCMLHCWQHRQYAYDMWADSHNRLAFPFRKGIVAYDMSNVLYVRFFCTSYIWLTYVILFNLCANFVNLELTLEIFSYHSWEICQILVDSNNSSHHGTTNINDMFESHATIHLDREWSQNIGWSFVAL